MNRIRLMGVVVLGLVVGSVRAQSPVAPPASPAPLKTSLDLGATLTDGNSESRKANGSLTLEGERAPLGSFLAGAQVNYGESKVNGETETDLDNAKAFGNAKKTLSAMTFAYGDISALYDNMAEIDYRVTAGPGAGFYLLKTPAHTLSMEAGPSYVWERVSEGDDDYLALRAAERYEYVVAPGTRFWESVEILPEVSDFSNFLVTAEAGAEAAVNAHFSLRLVLQDKYDSQPGAGLDKNDLILIGGVSLKL